MAAAIPRVPTVLVGRAFEHRSLSLLQARLSMSLAHVGARGDGGVDLQGWWWVPHLEESRAKDRRAIRILAQCKAHKPKLGPVHVRELEGAALVQQHSFATDAQGSLTSSAKQQGLVAMIISLSGFTSGAVKRAMSSPIPFLLLHLPAPESLSPAEQDEEVAQPLPIPTSPDSDPYSESDSLGSIVWNFKLAGATGLLGGHMEIRWALRKGQEGQGGRPVLYWKGKKLEHWVPDPQEIGTRFSGIY